jgi:hypothetical protein
MLCHPCLGNLSKKTCLAIKDSQKSADRGLWESVTTRFYETLDGFLKLKGTEVP